MIPIFISRKSEDAGYGRKLHAFLAEYGIESFDSEITLEKIGNSNFREVIDEILDETNYMVLIASKIEYLKSKWVKAEWDAFENELRSGRKNGNLILLISKKIQLSELPIALRQKQVFYIEDRPFDKMIPYLGGSKPTSGTKLQIERSSFGKYLFWGLLGVFLVIAAYLVLPKVIDPTPTDPNTIVADDQSLKDSFNKLKIGFLEEGLDKVFVFKRIKEMANSDPFWGYTGAELFQEKAISTPFMKDTYLQLSEELITYTDSLRNAK